MSKCILLFTFALAIPLVAPSPLSLPYFSPSSLNTSRVPPENENWMAKLPDNVSIRNLAIPGTHNSCAYDFTSKALIVDSFGYTQTWNLSEQLHAGIRYFDIRIRGNGWIYHGIRGTTSSFVSAMETFASFLDVHPQEGLIMRLQCNPLDDEQACLTDDVLSVLDAYHSKLLLSNQIPFMKDIRGRIFLIVENLRYSSAFAWNNGQITVQDRFSDISVDDKRKKVKAYIDLSKRRKDLFIINHCSATYLGVNAYNVEYAIAANSVVYSENGFSGVFPMDFPGEELVTHIIRQNDAWAYLSKTVSFVMWLCGFLVCIVGMVIAKNWYWKHRCESSGRKYYIVITENDRGKEPLLVDQEKESCDIEKAY